MIKSITIKNCKGIQEKTFNISLVPNQLSIFVAPNGFGKTSIAHSFASLKTSKIELEEEDYYNNNIENNFPELTIEDENGTYTANTTCNQISEIYSSYVINSRLNAIGKGQYIGPTIISKALMQIKPVILIENIPKSEKINVKISNIKDSFGKNGKIFTNLDNVIKNANFYKFVDSVHLLTADYKLIEKIKEIINSFSGTKDELFIQIEANKDLFPSNEKIYKLLNDYFVKFSSSYSTRIVYLLLINEMHNRFSNFSKFLKYQSYLEKKKRLCSDIDSFNSTREQVTYKIKSGKLIVEFPNPSLISNGQRDILTFYTELLYARNKLLKSDKAILIIDEVFDYLDDANLIVLQYFISNLISEFKNEKKFLYPILLTHLDPNYFHHFVVSKKQVRYLDSCKTTHIKISPLIKLISKREDILISNDLSTYFFHYHPSIHQIDISDKFESLHLPKEWGRPKVFLKNCFSEFNKYIKPENIFDSVKIAISLRLMIERLAYSELPSEFQEAFIFTKKTKEKLNFCTTHGIEIPEAFFLLGIIYNNTLHIYDINQDIETPLHSKLCNPTIKKMILDIYYRYIHSGHD